MKRFFRILSLVLVFVILTTSLVGCSASKRPLNYLKSAIRRSFEKQLGGELTSLLADALESGSIGFSYGGTDFEKTDIDKAEGTVYFDGDKEKFAATGTLTINGTAYDGAAWLSKDLLVLKSSAFFGSTNLGVDFKNLKGELPHSIFHNGSATAHARPNINSTTADAVTAWIDGLFSTWKSFDSAGDITDDLTDEFLESLTTYAPSNRYKKDGVIHISVTVDNSCLSRALRDTRAKALKNRKFCRRLRELAATRDAMESAKIGVVITTHADYVEHWLKEDVKIEELCAKIDNATPFALQIQSEVRALTGTLNTLSVSYEKEGKSPFSASVDISQKHSLNLSVSFRGTTRNFVWNLKEDKFKSLAADVSYKIIPEGGEPKEWMGSYVHQKKDDTFLLTFARGEDMRTFSGSFTVNRDGARLSVDSMKRNDTAYQLKLGLTLKVKDTMPTAPEYVNLVTIDEQRFNMIEPRAIAAKDALKGAFEKADLDCAKALEFLLDLLGVDEKIPSFPKKDVE